MNSRKYVVIYMKYSVKILNVQKLYFMKYCYIYLLKGFFHQYILTQIKRKIKFLTRNVYYWFPSLPALLHKELKRDYCGWDNGRCASSPVLRGAISNMKCSSSRQTSSINIETKTIFTDEAVSEERSKTSPNIESWFPVSSKWLPIFRVQIRKLFMVFDLIVEFPFSTSKTNQ